MIEPLVIVMLVILLGLVLLDRRIQKADHREVVAVLRLRAHSAEDHLSLLKAKLEQKAAVKVQQAEQKPKPLSGPQLRRMNEQANVQQWAEFQERPNSEVLKEQSNG